MKKGVLSVFLLSLNVAMASGKLEIAYKDGALVPVEGAPLHSTAIELPTGEQILNVVLGDAMSWQIQQPENQANMIFLKPIHPESRTNMLVYTEKSAYTFTLTARGIGDSVPFRYVIQKPTALTKTKRPSKTQVFPRYRAIGSGNILPKNVYDDGKFTHFVFHENQRFPAIYDVDSRGERHLSNFHLESGHMVVERLSTQFVLLDGSDRVDVTPINGKGDAAKFKRNGKEARG